jgi:hypothetical protein
LVAFIAFIPVSYLAVPVLSEADSAFPELLDLRLVAFIPVSSLAVPVLSEADSAFPELLDLLFVEFVFPHTLSTKR